MKKSIFLSLVTVLLLSSIVHAGGYYTAGSVSAITGNNADGSAPTATVLFKTERNGTTAISIAPYSSAGTVGQVNSPNGATAVNALFQVVGFPLCPETGTASDCTAALQKMRVPVSSNVSVPVAGLTTAVQTYGWTGVYASSLNFGSASVTSTDAVFKVSIRQMPPTGHIIEANVN